MGGRGGSSKKGGGGGGGGGGGAQMGADATYYNNVANDMEQEGLREQQDALRQMERAYEFNKEALSGWDDIEVSKLQSFYEGADERYFMGQMRQARADGIKAAIKANPKATSDELNKAEFKAASEFASSTVTLPKSISGRSTSYAPRTADMRTYFDKNGSPINHNARDGGYSSWKSSWGKSFADKERKRRDI